MKKFKEKFKDESGVTLVELLAAITILSIIVTAFLVFFVQAGRTNNVTNEMNEATFLAQEEMERLTHLSEIGTDVDDISQPENDAIEHYIEKDENLDTDLYKVIVEVREGGRLHAKMETWLPFAETETP